MNISIYHWIIKEGVSTQIAAKNMGSNVRGLENHKHVFVYNEKHKLYTHQMNLDNLQLQWILAYIKSHPMNPGVTSKMLTIPNTAKSKFKWK